MQIGGIPWWQLLGMFGFGAAAGLLIGLLVTMGLFKPDPSDWWGPLKGLFLILFVAAVCAPLAGIASVALTFAAHHAGLDALLPYLAGIGLVFLALLVVAILWHICTRPSNQRRRRRETRRSTRITP